MCFRWWLLAVLLGVIGTTLQQLSQSRKTTSNMSSRWEPNLALFKGLMIKRGGVVGYPALMVLLKVLHKRMLCNHSSLTGTTFGLSAGSPSSRFEPHKQHNMASNCKGLYGVF